MVFKVGSLEAEGLLPAAVLVRTEWVGLRVHHPPHTHHQLGPEQFLFDLFCVVGIYLEV